MVQVAFIWTNKLKVQHRRNIKNLKSHHTERDISGAYRGSARRWRPPTPLGPRQQTHLSVADSPQPDTAALHSSAQLSVVRFFRSGSLPASVPSSFVPAQHDSDIPLAGRLFKSLLSQLEVDSNCKKVGFIHVRSSFRDNCDKWWTLKVTFSLGKKK